VTADGELQAMGLEALQLERAGRLHEAEAAYQRLLARRPEEVHLNRGIIYSECLRRDEAAAAELRAALAINPRFVPALLNLANLQGDLGRRGATVATTGISCRQHY